MTTLDCLKCGCPREVDPDGPLTKCPMCGEGFVKIPRTGS